MTEEGS